MLKTTFDSRGINNSNVLTLGSMITNNDNAKEIIKTWLKTNFTSRWGGRKQEVMYSQLSLLRTLRFSLQIHYKT
jgi:ribose 5-phosphate isomerase RpiB